jgi:hypothetical protein
MWFYEWNRQPYGPLSKEAIAEAVRAGRINATTLVWREGMSGWKHLNETELASMLGLTPPPVINQNIPMNTPQVYGAVPPVANRQSKGLKNLFWWWFGLLLGGALVFILSQLITDQSIKIVLVCFYELVILPGIVLQYILVYKLWNSIQDGFARTSAGKAVGFMFIPFFNFYWMFVVYFGLAQDQNRYIDRHYPPISGKMIRKSHPALALIYMITFWLTIVLVFVMMISNLLSLINSASLYSGSYMNFLETFRLEYVIFFAIEMGLQFAMFLDFYQTGKSILDVEGK